MLLQSEMRGFLRQSVEESFSLKVDLHHQSVVRFIDTQTFRQQKTDGSREGWWRIQKKTSVLSSSCPSVLDRLVYLGSFLHRR